MTRGIINKPFWRAALLAAAVVSGATPAVAPADSLVPLPEPDGPVLLEVQGAITHHHADGVARFDRAMLEALPVVQLDTHTSVTDGVHRFEGFLMRDLLERVGARGDTVVATALNDYVIRFPITEFDRFDVLVAYRMDGKPLQASKKGPLWIVYPRDDNPILQDIRYDYRWVWQLKWLTIQ